MGYITILHRPHIPIPRGALRTPRHTRDTTARPILRSPLRYRDGNRERPACDESRGEGCGAGEAVGGDYAV